MMLVFLLYAAAAVCAGVDALRGRSLTALAVGLIAAGLAITTWPG